jgi:hypothetical protein
METKERIKTNCTEAKCHEVYWRKSTGIPVLEGTSARRSSRHLTDARSMDRNIGSKDVVADTENDKGH